MLKRFWQQPCRPYRDFQLMFTLLTLNFAIPAAAYALTPETAIAQFVAINDLLGGAPYTFAEAGSRFWRYLGTANVAALAFMCLLLQLDLKRYREVLLPLTFLKATAATLWLCGYVVAPEYPVLLGAALLDYATSAAFVLFAVRAHRAMAHVEVAALVPCPLSARMGRPTAVHGRATAEVLS